MKQLSLPALTGLAHSVSDPLAAELGNLSFNRRRFPKGKSFS